MIKFFRTNIPTRLFRKMNLNKFCTKSQTIEIHPQVRETLMNVLKQTAKCKKDKLTEKASFDELGFDSLDAVELIVAFEEHMGFDISNEDAENNINTVQDALVIFSKEFTAHLKKAQNESPETN